MITKNHARNAPFEALDLHFSPQHFYEENILRIFEFVDNINVLSQVSLLFEVENLAMASPATVSRCGMVYNDYTDLGWKPFVQSWLDKRHKVESTHNKWTGNLI